jgi:3-phosphoshikimate 1-carboxyvinyltransferase
MLRRSEIRLGVETAVERRSAQTLSLSAVPTDSIEITLPTHPLRGTITVPGSKSITNRAMLLAAMASGCSVLRSVLLSDDTQRMATALTALGFTLSVDETDRHITIEGRGGALPSASADLDAGGAGTAMRFIAGFLTLGKGRYRLDGNARMRQRPIGALLDAFNGLGVNAVSEFANACPPIVIDTSSAPFNGGEVAIDASLSSQFVSALLLPAPLWRNGLRLVVSGDTARPFIAMTLRLMEQWGATSRTDGDRIVVPGGQHYQAQDFTVEPDASSASYFAAAAAVAGGEVTLTGMRRDSVQGDLGFLTVLERMGARIEWGPDAVTVIGDGHLRGVDIAMNGMPDMVPTLAAIAPFASSPTRIRDVGFIRHHESDRIHVLAVESARLGATVTEHDDGLTILPSALHPATIATYDDHRIAMAFAITGLRQPGVQITNPDCVAKTYPDFFRDLRRLVESV